MELPYTITQAEDSMYLNQQYIVTLEYHYYQNGCTYTQLKKHDVCKHDKGKDTPKCDICDPNIFKVKEFKSKEKCS